METTLQVIDAAPEDEEATAPEPSRKRIQLAVDARRFADALTSKIAVSAGCAEAHAAFNAYVAATYWALAARLPEPLPDSARRALQLTPASHLAGIKALSEARAALAVTPAQLAEMTRLEIAEASQALAAFSGELLAALSPEFLTPGLRWKRLRPWVLGAVALGAVLSAVLLWDRVSDLALGKPWQTSSSAPSCNMDLRMCDGQFIRVFFVTNHEESPWIAIDLEAEKSVSRVTITNRHDCCQDRAIPLAIELSSDGKQYREVARRTEGFSEWDATFPPVQARYVRARALKKTTLHFERMTVH